MSLHYCASLISISIFGNVWPNFAKGSITDDLVFFLLTSIRKTKHYLEAFAIICPEQNGNKVQKLVV